MVREVSMVDSSAFADIGEQGGRGEPDATYR